MATDWEAFAKDINTGVLLELGTTDFSIDVPDGPTQRDKTGKKIQQKYITYKGTAVMGKYSSEFPSTDTTIIKAGDVKFVAQFEDKTFEPSEKLAEIITCKGVKYSVINVGRVAPDGQTNVVFVLQARRVN